MSLKHQKSKSAICHTPLHHTRFFFGSLHHPRVVLPFKDFKNIDMYIFTTSAQGLERQYSDLNIFYLTRLNIISTSLNSVLEFKLRLDWYWLCLNPPIYLRIKISKKSTICSVDLIQIDTRLNPYFDRK